jgi:hypothetical protein
MKNPVLFTEHELQTGVASTKCVQSSVWEEEAELQIEIGHCVK